MGAGVWQSRHTAMPVPVMSGTHSQIWHDVGDAFFAITRTITSTNRFCELRLPDNHLIVLKSEPPVSSLSATHRSFGIIACLRSTWSPFRFLTCLRVKIALRSAPAREQRRSFTSTDFGFPLGFLLRKARWPITNSNWTPFCKVAAILNIEIS